MKLNHESLMKRFPQASSAMPPGYLKASLATGQAYKGEEGE